ncbi:MAG: hypothetical protein QOG63_542 [Thermoleophilaceae bacterium]|nr:hypothetical protein [Thermoleophilaceae bacterium]
MRNAYRAMELELIDGLHAAGYDGIRLTHASVLRVLDEAGTRPSALAERSGLTRQALTQLVDDLAAMGFVTRGADPGDRRAQVVRYTDEGREALATARRLMREIEGRARRRLGRARFGELQDALAELADGD